MINKSERCCRRKVLDLYCFSEYLKVMRFEWDETKATTNVKKHGVTFDEATSVFAANYHFYHDEGDYFEPRFKAVGFDKYGRVLTVIYTMPDDNRIRIISARKATKNERKHYGKNRK